METSRIPEQMIFSTMMQLYQHEIYTNKVNPEEALENAKRIVSKMIEESRKIAENINGQPEST